MSSTDHQPVLDQPVLGALAAADPEIAERLVSRRAAITRGAAVSSAVAAGLRVASAPVALAALARDAFGQTRLPAVVNNVLNYALVLEELESRFYVAGVNAGIIPAQDLAIFTTIRDHELAHVAFLRTTLGAAARPSPTFDFTARGTFPTVFSSYATFLGVAQAFEDTGVRAYKGQAPALLPYKDVLTAALTIHSVEARHASEVRRLRGNFLDQAPTKGWITGNQTDVMNTAASYAGEESTTQAGLDVAAIGAAAGIGVNQVTESFDEPLTQAQVLSIVNPFIAS